MKQKILDLLACPKCKGALRFEKGKQRFICEIDKIAYPVRDGIPVLLESEAERIETI